MAVIYFYFFHTVCAKLCVHLAQPDIPAGGRSFCLVQQDGVFGPSGHQVRQPGRRRAHRLLQSSVQTASTEGELRPAGRFLTYLDFFFCQRVVTPTSLQLQLWKCDFDPNAAFKDIFKPSLSVSCFVQQNFDFPDIEESQPSGAALLIHSKTLRCYLSLLNSSQQEETQEACCGVLQNLTTNKGIVGCSNAVGLPRRPETWVSASTGVRCDEPGNCAEAQRPTSPRSTFTVKQGEPAEECNGADRKLGKEPEPPQCHR